MAKANETTTDDPAAQAELQANLDKTMVEKHALQEQLDATAAENDGLQSKLATAATAYDALVVERDAMRADRDGLRNKLDRIAEAVTANDLHHGTPGGVDDVVVERLADHRALLDRIAAMPDAPVAPTDRVSFALPPRGDDDRLPLDEVERGVRSANTYILPGDEHGALVVLAPIVADPDKWDRRGGRLIYTGEFGITGTGLGPQEIAVTHFGLAASPDGPVVDVAAAGGKAQLRDGTTFKFPAGSVVFGD